MRTLISFALAVVIFFSSSAPAFAAYEKRDVLADSWNPESVNTAAISGKTANSTDHDSMVRLYADFVESGSYQRFIPDSQNSYESVYGAPSKYAILDINGDGIEELIIAGETASEFTNFMVFSYDKGHDEIYSLSLHSVASGKEDEGFSLCYGSLRFSARFHALVFTETRPEYFGGVDFFVVKGRNIVSDFSLWFERDIETQQVTYGITESGTTEILSEDEYFSYMGESSELEWNPISPDHEEGVKGDKVLVAVNEYDENDTLIGKTQFEYEGMLIIRTKTQTYRDSVNETVYDYTYDDEGRLLSKHLEGSEDSGVKGDAAVDRSYNDEGLLVSESYLGAIDYWMTEEYTYDNDEQLIWQKETAVKYETDNVECDRVETVYSYSHYTNERGNLVSVRHNEVYPDSEYSTCEYIYNAAGQMIQDYDDYWLTPIKYEYIDDPYFCVRDELETIDNGKTTDVSWRMAYILDSAGKVVYSFIFGRPETVQMDYDEDGYLISAVDIERIYLNYDARRYEFIYGELDDVNDDKPIGADGSTQEPETNDEKDFENYLVERVRAYADDTMYRQYDDIIKSDASSETKVQQLTELFVYYGFLDVQDGLVYINKTTQARSAYLALTNNEMYSCYRMWNWLNFTTAGRAIKVILIADGLTFNNELSTWLDPLTYVGAKDGPGVEKYKDMLYDFMSAEATKIEVFETIDTISEITKNLTDAAKERANSLIKKLEKCETPEERASLLHSLEAKSIFADRASETDEGKLSFTLNDESGFGQFARAVGLATKSLSFVDIVVTDAFDIIDINSRLAVYNEYKDFLEEVMHSTDLPWEMRLAAAEIIEEFDDGVFGQIKKIAYDLVDWSGASGILEEAGLKNILTESGYTTFSDFLGAIEITSWAMNQIIDYGAISKGATFVEGYAYLSNHFLNKLINDRIAFRANQTPENAKKFINTYNILYQLRYKGEEAVLKMNKIDGLAARFTDFGYSFKEAAEKDIFAVLEGCKFEDADETMLPSSAKYKAKTVISCPVNVEIYDPNGNYITTLYDGVESDITNEYGRFSVVYRSYTDSYAKVICLKNEGNYIIKADGINSGLVNIEMCIDHSGQIESYYATDVAIDTGNSIHLVIDDIVKENEYGFDKDGDGIVDEHRKIETKPDSSDPSEPLPDDDVEYPDQTDNDGLWMYGVAGIALMAGAGLVIFLVSRKKRSGRTKKYSPMR